jgi:hypothetical protein
VSTQKDFIKTALRVPPDLHKEIHAASKESERTFNAEIVYRLRMSLRPTEQRPHGAQR